MLVEGYSYVKLLSRWAKWSVSPHRLHTPSHPSFQSADLVWTREFTFPTRSQVLPPPSLPWGPYSENIIQDVQLLYLVTQILLETSLIAAVK